MNKVRIVLLSLILLCMGSYGQKALAQAQNEYTQGFGYADKNVGPADFKDTGIQEEGKVLTALIQMPDGDGIQINKVDFYTHAEDPTGKLVVLEEGKVLLAQDLAIESGWNTASFPEITTQKGKRYFIGYQAKTKKGNTYGISFDGQETLKEGAIGLVSDTYLVKDTQAELTDIWAKRKAGTLPIYVSFKDPKGSLENVAYLIEPYFSKTLVDAGAKEKLRYKIRNLGTKQIDNIDLVYSFSSGEEKTVNVPVGFPVASSDKMMTKFDFPTKGGSGYFTVAVKNVNGKANIFTEGQKEILEYIVKMENGAIPKKTVLIEKFTSENCPNCPAVDPVLQGTHEEMAKKNVDVNIIAYHVDRDFLQLDECVQLQRLSMAGVLPVMNYDRTEIKEGVLALGAIFDCLEMTEKVCKNDQLAIFEDVNSSFDVANNKLKLSVKGKLYPYAFFEDAHITAVVVEDNIPAIQQGGVEGKYLHQHAARAFLTPAKGTPLNVAPDGSFSIDLTKEGGTLEKIDPDNSYIILWVNRSLDNPMSKRQVLASLKAPLTGKTSAVEMPEYAKPYAYVQEGHILVQGAVDHFEVYDLTGTLVTSSSKEVLSGGVYIVRVHNAYGTFTSKILVR